VQALPATPRQVSTCGSPLPPSTACTTRFDMLLYAEKLSGPRLSPSNTPVLPSQSAIMNTPTCVPLLASQDVNIKSSLSVVTDSISNIRALLEDVSLINEINCLNPIIRGVIFTGAISSNIFLGVKGSHSLHQDYYQDPEEYNFDPDPGTNNSDFQFEMSQGNLPFVLYHFADLQSSSVVGSPNRLSITYLPDMDMAANVVPVYVSDRGGRKKLKFFIFIILFYILGCGR